MTELMQMLYEVCDELELNPKVIQKFNEDVITFKHKYVYRENEYNEQTEKLEFKEKTKIEDVYVRISQYPNFIHLNIDAFERGLGYPKESWSKPEIEKCLVNYLKLDVKPKQLTIFDFC